MSGMGSGGGWTTRHSAAGETAVEASRPTEALAVGPHPSPTTHVARPRCQIWSPGPQVAPAPEPGAPSAPVLWLPLPEPAGWGLPTRAVLGDDVRQVLPLDSPARAKRAPELGATPRAAASRCALGAPDPWHPGGCRREGEVNVSVHPGTSSDLSGWGAPKKYLG